MPKPRGTLTSAGDILNESQLAIGADGEYGDDVIAAAGDVEPLSGRIAEGFGGGDAGGGAGAGDEREGLHGTQ